MARISRATRETIKTIIVLVIIILLILVYIVYPLNRSKGFFGRPDLDNYDPKVIPANNAALFDSAGVQTDTFRVDPDGLTSLAVVACSPSARFAKTRGLFVIPTDSWYPRASVVPLAKALTDSGFAVITYDQRASGASTGKYFSDGQMEGQDLEAVIADLQMHGRLVSPLVAVGHGLSGDASILASLEENRISAVVAVEPYLSTDKFVATLRADRGSMWFPFWEPVVWWWYKIRSGYAIDFRRTVPEPRCATLLILSSKSFSSPEVTDLKTKVGSKTLRIMAMPESDAQLADALVSFVTQRQ
jgi:pimeloyl-ACP methyl ester carboxylesterase